MIGCSVFDGLIELDLFGVLCWVFMIIMGLMKCVEIV